MNRYSVCTCEFYCSADKYFCLNNLILSFKLQASCSLFLLLEILELYEHFLPLPLDFVFTFGIPGGTLLYARNFTALLLFPATSVSVAANECPALSVTGAAPFTQLLGASEARNLPLSCVGPFINETYQSASPAPFAFLHLEPCEIVKFGSSRSANTSVSISKHIGLMQFYFTVSLDNVIFIGILRVIFILLLSAYLFQKCKDKSGLLMERNDNADRNLLVSEI
ncbi:hypothetical protein T03_7800 [Trichinella britovi]|uniref:Uncharacterized protein n=1 Tax=Trichinella britovi TaxID=45882 RepID=A0A0V1C594_TRIBR|nr:hypothetical protein T03_7800 [Trichinella britovi]